MIIKRMEIHNFKGIKRLWFNLPQIVSLCATNGAGKTSLLEALRFILTGEEPEGNIIRNGANSCSVSAVLVNDAGTEVEYERIKENGKPQKFKVNGKATTNKNLNESIMDMTGVSVDKIKVISSTDVVAAMKPQEFSSFILDYIPEKMDIEKIISLIPTATPEALEIIIANLPEENIGLDDIDEFYETLKSTRKDLKAKLAALKQLYSEGITEKPVEDDALALEDKLKELNNREYIYEQAKKEQERYTKELLDYKALEKDVKTLKEKLKTLEGFERVSDSDINTKREEINRAIKTIADKKNAFENIKSALVTLENTLTALNTSVCPVSPLITCGQDKSVAKNDIEETIKSTKEAVDFYKADLEKAEADMGKLKAELSVLEEKSKKYKERIDVQSKIDFSEKALGNPPVKPEEVTFDKEAFDTEIFQVKNAISNLQKWKETQKLAIDIERLTIVVNNYEFLVKAFAEKGEVRTGVIASYLGVFEEICNERSQKIRTDVSFKFESDAGVVPKASFNGTDYMSYDELSGGEKAYLLFIIIDMLNQLVGTKLLFLDELSVMDSESFEKLVDTVLLYKSDYDHIFLSTVNHDDTVQTLKDKSIPMVQNLSELEGEII